jgi:hypothetical protein
MWQVPPSFKERSDLNLVVNWETGGESFALFCGMLAGAMGWDGRQQMPDRTQVQAA